MSLPTERERAKEHLGFKSWNKSVNKRNAGDEGFITGIPFSSVDYINSRKLDYFR